ncbi:hypothetical protein [Kitasatospora sp. NPDC018619]|uniref:hypothetical protein n=1 Tax=unclassified Kitasatospora TaxID=2633591 RepID=UPI0037A75A39
MASSAPTPSPALRSDRPAASAASRSRPSVSVLTTAAWVVGQDWLPTPNSTAAAVNPGSPAASSSVSAPAARSSRVTAAGRVRAPRSIQRPVSGTTSRPDTIPADSASPAAPAPRCSTPTPYSSRNGRSSPPPTASTASAAAYRGPPAAVSRRHSAAGPRRAGPAGGVGGPPGRAAGSWTDFSWTVLMAGTVRPARAAWHAD